MPRMQILTPAEYTVFETPPRFNSVERKRFFDTPQSLDGLLASFRTPANQIGFVLALGYFKATKRFFARQFHDADAAYVAKQLGILPGVFDLSDYEEPTARRHRKIIMDSLGFEPFATRAKLDLGREIHTMIRSQMRPKVIFRHAVEVLVRRKTEVPSARALTDLITSELRRHKGTLTQIINTQVPPELRELLDALLEKVDASTEPSPQIQRFKLTLLKQISQSTKPSKIKSTLNDWQTLRLLHDDLAPVISALDLTHDGIRYYAHLVLKSQIFQVSRRTDDDRHLHLICFITHQFYRLQDTLADILLKVVQTTLNAGKRHHKDQYYAARTEQRRAVSTFVDSVDRDVMRPLTTIEAIAFGCDLSDAEKVQRIQEVLTQGRSQRSAAQEQLTTFKTQAEREANDADYYVLLTAFEKMDLRAVDASNRLFKAVSP